MTFLCSEGSQISDSVAVTCAQDLEAFFHEAGVAVAAGSPAPEAIEWVIGTATEHGRTFAPPEALSAA